MKYFSSIKVKWKLILPEHTVFLLTVSYLYSRCKTRTFLFIMNEDEYFPCSTFIFYGINNKHFLSLCVTREDTSVRQGLNRVLALGASPCLALREVWKLRTCFMLLLAPIFPSVCRLVVKELCRKLTELKNKKDGPRCIFSMLF